MAVQPATPSHACIACGAPSLRPLFTARDWYLGVVPGTFDYERCDVCGTVAIAAQPDDDVLALAYAKTYTPHSARRGLVERVGEPLAQREARRLLQHADPSRAVLDVGCGTGRFLERLRRAGWRGRMVGVEPAPDVALDTSGRLGIEVYAAALEDSDIEPGSFGTIVLRHVIEHVRAPHATLRRIRDLLEPHGVLYLATPDARAFAAAFFGRYWHGYDPPRHLFAFSRDGVRRLLVAEGFKIVDERWDFSPQMWTGSLRHALGRGRRSRWAAIAGHDLNPLAAIPAVVAAGAEVALHRSTMYAATARRRS